jgi:hypothetical protein
MKNLLLVGTRKGLFRIDAKDRTIGEPDFLAQPVSAVLADPRDGALYAALNLGHFGVKLHRSDDNGESWTELPAPAFPAATENVETAPSVEMIWTLVAGGADQPGRLWAGTIPGALFRSDDRGASWQLVDSLWNAPERAEWGGGGYDHPGLHTFLVDPRASRMLTAGISTGGVWRSADDGATWQLVGKGLRAAYMPPEKAHDLVSQDVHRLAPCAAAPDSLWCQHHNSIFHSLNGGETFTEITDVTPSVFGFAVAAHPKDPLTAWFAPAVKDECRVPVNGRFVVTRTTDGGKTLTQLSSGLPESASYDLVYRHALEVDATGNTLAMGSTTGNLWIGEGGGEHWRLISAHLPPIAQVAWA